MTIVARVDRKTNASGNAAIYDDLSREVYCVLGLPIDVVDMQTALRSIDSAVARGTPFVISTTNLNFLTNSLADRAFAKSLVMSDLCPPDGMPIVWIARLIGIPINERVAGSDIFAKLKSLRRPAGPIKVFLFGATERAAIAACENLNSHAVGLTCAGWLCPGFGTVDELSQDQFVEKINSSDADFLVVALGAKKGQLWLQRNHERLRIPVRAHLGATINFEAGLLRRAPVILQRLCLEWLWRIKEEPYLWKRYWHDGTVLLHLLGSRVVPIALGAIWLQLRKSRCARHLDVEQVQCKRQVTLKLSGYVIAEHIPKVIGCFRDAIASRKEIVVDFAETRAVDARAFGLLLMLEKKAVEIGITFKFVGISRGLERQFRLNGLKYMLSLRGSPGVNPCGS
jgi:N-acetylglucosaminyldiphosphoundecaprenol N-acetyl-beta-D-mannosaminyltransferase